MFQLKAKGQEEGEHELEKCLAIVKQLKVRRFMLKIDGDGPIFAGLTGTGSIGMSGSATTDSLDSNTNLFGSRGDVFTQGTLTMRSPTWA